MVRSVGIAAVVVGLAWTGLSFAQPSSPVPSGDSTPRERYITVREDGKTPQRCKLLKAWHEPNGTPVFQVRAVDSGEVMTIVGSAPASASEPGARAMSTRIFRWGPENKPPAGAPQPPTGSVATPPPAPVSPQARVPSPPRQSAPNPIVPYPTPAPVVSQSSPAARPATTIWTPMTPQPNSSPLPPHNPAPTPPAVAATTVQRPSASAPARTVSTPVPARTVSAPVLAQPYPAASTNKADKPSTAIISPPSGQGTKSVTVVSPPEMKPTATPQVARTPQIIHCTPSTPPQPRLVPLAAGTVICEGPCNACCPPKCSPCCQSCCVCCPPPRPRQSLLSRLFNSTPCCPPAKPSAVVAKPSTPAPTAPAVAAKPKPVVKVATEPAQPRDWRESWGKVEPWKGAPPTAASKPTDVSAKQPPPIPVQFDPSKHLAQAPVKTAAPKLPDPPKHPARAPVKMDPPKLPDPLKDPAWFGNSAMKQKLANSKIPDSDVTTPAQKLEKKIVVQNTPRPTAPPSMPPAPPASEATALPPTQPRGRVVTLPADEANAFSTPETSPKKDEQQQPGPNFNAFDREETSPPPGGGVPAMAGGPQGPMPMRPPAMGPMPMPMPPRPPMPPPMMPDTGVPSGMANAFTLAGTRRPIPADFGGTPQEPNGFGNPAPFTDIEGLPRSYAVPRPGMMPPQYPGMPGRPVAVNPLMSVPPTPVASSRPTEPVQSAGGVPQLLATLRDSLYPSQREAAAQQLSEQNWRTQPQVVEVLTKGAREDPAGTVRAACVRALARMKVNTSGVTALVQDLKNDRDARVRHEAEEALGALGVAPTARQDSGVQQASHK